MTQVQLNLVGFKLNEEVDIVSVDYSSKKSKIKCVLSNQCELTIKPWKKGTVIILEEDGRKVRLSTDFFFSLYNLRESLLFLNSIVSTRK